MSDRNDDIKVYQDKKTKAEDYKSSAYTLLFVGVIGMIALVLMMAFRRCGQIHHIWGDGGFVCRIYRDGNLFVPVLEKICHGSSAGGRSDRADQGMGEIASHGGCDQEIYVV